jgi:hypothetical protein
MPRYGLELAGELTEMVGWRRADRATLGEMGIALMHRPAIKLPARPAPRFSFQSRAIKWR